jgi:hypothetical protein
MQIAILVVQLLFLVAFVIVGQYLREKGKNLATKEDVGEITSIVENIKKENAKELAALAHERHLDIKRLEQLNDLRLASIDERLKAYQEAYSLAFRMLDAMGNRQQSFVVLKACTNFWEHRSLYISEAVRVALDKAMIALHCHESTCAESSPVTPDENRAAITQALRVIERSVNLPEFSSAAESQVAGTIEKNCHFVNCP